MLRRHLLMLVGLAALSVFATTVRAANPQVELDTSAGKIKIELYPDAAPKTVEDFLAYVRAKHADGFAGRRIRTGTSLISTSPGRSLRYNASSFRTARTPDTRRAVSEAWTLVSSDGDLPVSVTIPSSARTWMRAFFRRASFLISLLTSFTI